jgi:hypothetical protein
MAEEINIVGSMFNKCFPLKPNQINTSIPELFLGEALPYFMLTRNLKKMVEVTAGRNLSRLNVNTFKYVIRRNHKPYHY